MSVVVRGARTGAGLSVGICGGFLAWVMFLWDPQHGSHYALWQVAGAAAVLLVSGTVAGRSGARLGAAAATFGGVAGLVVPSALNAAAEDPSGAVTFGSLLLTAGLAALMLSCGLVGATVARRTTPLQVLGTA